MIKSKHKSIQLHKESKIQTVLECYQCGNRNSFILGFVTAKTDTVIILLCREPCLNKIEDGNWDTDNWTPLLENKMLINWLVKPPEETEQRRARQISVQQINNLEEMWL